jgi:hypothetical protein
VIPGSPVALLIEQLTRLRAIQLARLRSENATLRGRRLLESLFLEFLP